MADDHIDFLRGQLPDGVEQITAQGLAGDRMEQLGPVRLEARPQPGGQNDYAHVPFRCAHFDVLNSILLMGAPGGESRCLETLAGD